MKWMDTRILDRWTLSFPDLPDLGGWDVWEYWERERFDSLQDHLGPDDLLMDIGAEFGGLSACIAQFCPRMILVEPEPSVWPTIRAVFEHNDLAPPIRSIVSLISDRTIIPETIEDCVGWPPCSEGAAEDDLEGRRVYRYLHQHGRVDTPQITVDDTVLRTGLVPTALNLDVEGAELRVLRGAETLLRYARPIVWCSVHADLMERDYGDSPAELIEYMQGLGYVHTHLAVDHESHELFRNPEGR